MTQVISILNLQQGGGKTTTVINLATALKRAGHSVLTVDLAPEETLLHRIRLPNPAHLARAEKQAKIISTIEGWHLMRAAVSVPLLHARLLERLAPGTDPEADLDIVSLLQVYDYVLFDCSTTELSLVTEALSLADEVIVPLDSESLQFHDAVDRMVDIFATQLPLNPHLRFGGVFLAHYAPQFRRAREMLTALFNVLGPITCFSAFLRDNDTIRQAEKRRVSVITDAPTSQAAHAYYQLADQLTRAAVPRLNAPTLLVMPGRALVAEATPNYGTLEQNLFVPETRAAWRERALHTADPNQAVRYAVFALLEQPTEAATLELFEERLTERIDNARYEDIDAMIELSAFLADHELDHYAAQLLRRITLLNPSHLRAWADLARLSHLQAERAFALQQALGLDQGLAAAEAPEKPRRTPRTELPSFAPPLRLQPATP